MSALVLTGATGYLGSHLAHALSAAEYDLILIKRSTSNTARIDSLLRQCTSYDIDHTDPADIFRAHDVSGIIHAAATYGRKGESFTRMVADNVNFPLSLLERATPGAFFVNIGTALPATISPYALAKDQFRQWLELLADKRDCVHVALEHFYGPDDQPDKFVTRVIRDLVTGKASIDLTEGVQRRDFIYVDDVVAALVSIASSCRNATPGFREIPLGSGSAIAVKDLILDIARIAGNTTSRLNFGAVPLRPHEVLESRADTTTIEALGWKPRVPLEEGLGITIASERARLSGAHSP